jgi:hypothetical protein
LAIKEGKKWLGGDIPFLRRESSVAKRCPDRFKYFSVRTAQDGKNCTVIFNK